MDKQRVICYVGLYIYICISSEEGCEILISASEIASLRQAVVAFSHPRDFFILYRLILLYNCINTLPTGSSHIFIYSIKILSQSCKTMCLNFKSPILRRCCYNILKLSTPHEYSLKQNAPNSEVISFNKLLL